MIRALATFVLLAHQDPAVTGRADLRVTGRVLAAESGAPIPSARILLEGPGKSYGSSIACGPSGSHRTMTEGSANWPYVWSHIDGDFQVELNPAQHKWLRVLAEGRSTVFVDSSTLRMAAKECPDLRMSRSTRLMGKVTDGVEG